MSPFNHLSLLGKISSSSSLTSKYMYIELLAAFFIQLQSKMARGNINMPTLTIMLTLSVCVLSSAWIVVPCSEIDRWPDQDRDKIPEMKQKLINITPIELTVEDVWLQVTEPTGWEESYSAKGSNAPGVHNRAPLVKLVKESLRGRATVRSCAVIEGVSHSHLKVIIDTTRGWIRCSSKDSARQLDLTCLDSKPACQLPPLPYSCSPAPSLV